MHNNYRRNNLSKKRWDIAWCRWFCPPRRHPFGGARIRRGSDVLGPGLGNIPKGPTVRTFKEVDTGMVARRGNRGHQCPAFNMDQEHKEFVQKMK